MKSEHVVFFRFKLLLSKVISNTKKNEVAKSARNQIINLGCGSKQFSKKYVKTNLNQSIIIIKKTIKYFQMNQKTIFSDQFKHNDKFSFERELR